MTVNTKKQLVKSKKQEVDAEKLMSNFQNIAGKNNKVVFKLFRKGRNEELHPLYVLADKPTPTGKWLTAEEGILKTNGKVKAKGGELAFRPGWHTCEYPVARHIGEMANANDGYPSYRPSNQVWCACAIRTDYHDEWQSKADNAGTSLRDKCLKEIPYRGYYSYKTTSKADAEWYISGELRVIRELTQREVVAINKLNPNGVQDLPRLTRLDRAGNVIE